MINTEVPVWKNEKDHLFWWLWDHHLPTMAGLPSTLISLNPVVRLGKSASNFQLLEAMSYLRKKNILLISAFHGPWLRSPIFPCLFVRLVVRSSRYGDTRPNLTSSCPTPPNPYIFWKLMIIAIQKWIRNTNTQTKTNTKTNTKTKKKTKTTCIWRPRRESLRRLSSHLQSTLQQPRSCKSGAKKVPQPYHCQLIYMTGTWYIWSSVEIHVITSSWKQR